MDAVNTRKSVGMILTGMELCATVWSAVSFTAAHQVLGKLGKSGEILVKEKF